MRRIWLLVLAVFVVTVTLGAATVAFFGATAANQDNDFVAGTLELTGDRDNEDSVPGPMFYTTAEDGITEYGDDGLYPDGFWKPGDENTKVFQIENIGSLNGKLTYVRASLQVGDRDLADKLLVTVTGDVEGNQVLATGTLGDFIDNDQAFLTGPVAIDTEDMVSLWFTVTFPDGDPQEDNLLQGMALKTSFFVGAEQAN